MPIFRPGLLFPDACVYRKLCILKGIYPRDPKRKIKGKDKTYYFVKDINYMAHDPLVSKFREYRAWRKKVKKADGRNDKEKVKALQNTKPEFNLTHLVKERFVLFHHVPPQHF